MSTYPARCRPECESQSLVDLVEVALAALYPKRSSISSDHRRASLTRLTPPLALDRPGSLRAVVRRVSARRPSNRSDGRRPG